MKSGSDLDAVLIVSVSAAMVRRRTRRRKKRTAYPGLGAAPARKSGAWLGLVLGALVLVNLYVFVWDKHTGVRAIRQQAEAQSIPAMAMPSTPMPAAPAPAPAGAPAPVPHAATPAITGKVGKSDTLGKLLKKSGLTAAEADEIIRALSGVLDFRTIRAGQTFRIERGSDGRVTRFELELTRTRRVRATRAPSGTLAAERIGE